MSKTILLGFKRDGTGPILLKGTETSSVAQRTFMAEMKASDTYEWLEQWHRGIPLKTKRVPYTTQPTLTVTVDAKSIVYGAAKPKFTVTCTGFTDGDTPKRNDLKGAFVFTHSYDVGSDVGTYTVTPSGKTSQKYILSYATGTLTVSQAPLGVTVKSEEIEYGDAAPTWEPQFAGFVAEDDKSKLGGSPSYAVKDGGDQPVPNVAEASPGEYTVEISGYTSTNYAITFTAGALTIVKKALALTVNDETITEGGSEPSWSFTGDGFAGSETASVLDVTNAVYTVYESDGETEITGAFTDLTEGTYVVKLSGVTSDNYDISYVAGTLTVTGAG